MALRPSDTMQIYTHQTDAGLNYKNLKATFIPDTEFTYANNFPYNGKRINGMWFNDKGYDIMDKEQREPRHYCIKGKATFMFSGTNLTIRLMLDSGQGTAAIYIDEKAPSAVGIRGAVDILDCNLDHYGFGEGATMQYHDVVVAEGLTDGSHTCEIYANNPGGVYFLLAGAKVHHKEIQPLTIPGYHASETLAFNQATLRLVNESKYPMRDITISIPGRAINRDTGKSFPNPYVIQELGVGEQIPLLIGVDGRGYEDGIDLTMNFHALYCDPESTQATTTLTTVLDPHSNRINLSGDWLFEPLSASNVLCGFTSNAGDTLTLWTRAKSLTITLLCDWGYPTLNVSVDGNIMSQWSLQADEETFKDFTLSDLAAEEKVITINVPKGHRGDSTFAFSRIVLTEEVSYIRSDETIPITMSFDYIKPFGIEGLAQNSDGQYSYEGTVVRRTDDSLPRRNQGAKEVRIMRRHATFALNYSDANHENLKYYDLVVVDPGTVTRKEVAAWQKLGIKVFGYVSFGEEDGVTLDPWDITSKIVPHTDDGKGVGGYASYYMKGGYGYAELNQCLHDGLIETQEKKCLLGDSHYFTGVGCCTRVCKHDSREGYKAWTAGETCGGGHTKSDYWVRTGDEACTNVECPNYSPYHGGCPHYEHHDGWGQDLNYTTPDYPDQNGIWGSTYVNPLAPRWKEKLSTFYLRRVFGLPKLLTEKVRLTKYSSDLTGTSYIFRTREYPIDKAEEVHLYSASGYEYTNLEFNFDPTSGAFQVEAEAVETKGDQNMELTVTYHVVGMGADGVFMDTLDTVDVYPSEAFQQGMAKMINELKEEYPEKSFLANRGFSITKDIIKSCDYVMFETFISEYNWENGEYYKLTDLDTIAYNEDIKNMLRNLRKDYHFDVLALNYCADGPEGDELRELIAQECYAEGYMSWSSNIMLGNVQKPYLVKSQDWKKHIKSGNPFFTDFPAVDSAWLVREQNEQEIRGDYSESNRIWKRLPDVERDDWYEISRIPVVSGWLERSVTTLAWCWRLELSNGNVMCFTSCDVDLVIDGETYEACAGFAPTAVSSSDGLATDNLDVQGMITSDRITADDIFLGVYDNAKIRIFICDYEHPQQNRFILREGRIGKITSGKIAFKAEIRGLMDAFQQQAGDLYQRKCRARLGDSRCKYQAAADTATGEVTSVRDDGSIFTSISRTDNFFNYGILTFESGLNNGSSYEVEQSLGSNGQIRFFSPPMHEVVVGDRIRIVPGCDGEPSTCKNRFHNMINFRGEPYIPGNDYSVSYPMKVSGNIVPEGASVRLKTYNFQG